MLRKRHITQLNTLVSFGKDRRSFLRNCLVMSAFPCASLNLDFSSQTKQLFCDLVFVINTPDESRTVLWPCWDDSPPCNSMSNFSSCLPDTSYKVLHVWSGNEAWDHILLEQVFFLYIKLMNSMKKYCNIHLPWDCLSSPSKFSKTARTWALPTYSYQFMYRKWQYMTYNAEVLAYAMKLVL